MKLQFLWRSVLATGILLSPYANSIANQDEPESLKPVVREAVPPKVWVQDLRQAAPEQATHQWQPGDPVRVVDDLKSSNEAAMSQDKDQPVVRQPVSPESMDRKLDELPIAEPYSTGDPVRVVEDLKEDPQDETSTDEEQEEDPREDRSTEL